MDLSTPDSGSDPFLGQIVHGYRIEQRLGGGGAERVYRAHDTRLDRDVAIKFLVAATPELAARFDREARVISSLSHSNVAQVFTVGQHAAWPFYVMEYFDGGSLARFLEPGRRLQGPRALELLTQAASGLAAAYERGVVHLDVKPSNLMVQGSDRLAIVDFGLARRGDQVASPVESALAPGTSPYLAPEQLLGQPVDFRADIYALGATFYHLLSGFTPSPADASAAGRLQQVQAPSLPLKERNPRIPTSLARVIDRMVAPSPNERFASYDELLAELALARRGSVPSAPPVSDRPTAPPRRHTAAAPSDGVWKTVLGASLLGLVLAAIVLYVLLAR